MTTESLKGLSLCGVLALACVPGARADVTVAVADPVRSLDTAEAIDTAGAPLTGGVADRVRSMAGALRTLNYEGTFVHLVGDNLTSLRIVHANDGGGERERLSALDGEAREVLRDHSLVTCIWPDSRSVVVGTSKPRSPLPAIDASLGDNRHYRLSALPDDRVAGRPVHGIEVAPRDGLRYGYRFWVDRTNAMLLRSMLLDGRGHPLEQMLFTRIEYPDAIDPARFEVAGDGAERDWLDAELARANAANSAETAETAGARAATTATRPAAGPDARIRFDGLPDGFRLMPLDEPAMSAVSGTPGETGPVSHLMLGDGVAMVSVYVEHATVDAQDDSVAGPARMGAVNAFGLSLANAFVTAVGEVPAETVRRIALATRVSP